MSRVVSNHKILDKIKDKDLIEQIEIEHKEELKKVDYAIDLNTNKVKQNNQYTFYITDNINKDILSYDDALNKDLQKMYLNNMDTYNKGLNAYKDLDNYRVIIKDKVDKQDEDKLIDPIDPIILDKYTSKIKDIDTLNKAIISFNEFYDSMYLNGFNLRVKDLLNDSIKKEYVKQLASAYTQVYVSDLIKIKDNKSDYKEFIDNNKLDSVKDNIKKFIEDTNKELETQAKELSDIIYKSNLERFNTEIDTTINNNKQYYNKVHKLYQEIDNKIIDIVNAFKVKEKQLITNAPKPKIPKSKEISLYASKIFNNTYYKSKNTILDLNGGYTLTMKIVVDEINDLRDIILYDEVRNQIVSLYPIDLALFIGFTNINALNGGNIPITLDDALKVISENNIKIKKGNKQIKYYEDRLLLFDRTKVLAKVVKNISGKEYVLYENYEQDPISILSTKRVYIQNREKTGYEIGQSAILSIIKTIEKDSGINYLTTIQNANKYINDGQSNTIAILNMKYHILISVLQRKNSMDKGNIYNPIINLDDLYNQLAKLQGKDELNRTEKNRVRDQIDKFMHHLYKKDLIESYSYNNIKDLGNHKTKNTLISEYKSSDNDLIKIDEPNKNKAITHIIIRPKK